MTYLGKPRWIDSEEEDRPFAVALRLTREEQETEKPVQFPGRDEYLEYPADFMHRDDDDDNAEDRVLPARPDPLLDEPEWGTAKPAPGRKKGDGTVQTTLDTDT